MHEGPIYELLEFINILMLTIKLDVYEAFVNPEESFCEGLFCAQITLNVLLYLQMFHE